MTESGLPQSLADLHARYLSQREKLAVEVSELEAKLHKIGEAIQVLKNQEQASHRRLYEKLRLASKFSDDEREETLELTFQSLQASQRTLAELLGGTQDRREALEGQIHLLLSHDPGLEADLLDYHRFEACKEQALQSTPAYYRRTLEEAHEKMRTRLLPLLELEEALLALPDQLNLSLPIFLAFDAAASQLFLALPIASRDDRQEDNLTRRMDALENAVLGAFATLAVDPNWILIETERSDWAGFRALTALSEYVGKGGLTEAIQSHLERKLATHWPFAGSGPLPQVAYLDWKTWKAGQGRSAALRDLDLVSAEVFVPEVELKSGKMLPSTLFTPSDVLAWERPLRVSQGSLWTATARRLRTLVVRLVAQGRVGCAGVEDQAVWEGLPVIHRASFQATLPRLVEAGILLREISPDRDGDLLCLNPRSLVDVQDLVNRDITSFWAPLVSETS